MVAESAGRSDNTGQLEAFVALRRLDWDRGVVETAVDLLINDLADLGALLAPAYHRIVENGMTTVDGVSTPLWVLAYLHHRVVWASYAGYELHTIDSEFEPDLLQQLRLFGPGGEYYIWRGEDGFNARLRLDALPLVGPQLPEKQSGFTYARHARLATQPDVLEEWQALWGTRSGTDPGEGWTEVTEQRGIRLIIPHRLEAYHQLPLRLLVRHYITYDADDSHDSGLCLFSDMRLVEVRDASMRPLVLTPPPTAASGHIS